MILFYFIFSLRRVIYLAFFLPVGENLCWSKAQNISLTRKMQDYQLLQDCTELIFSNRQNRVKRTFSLKVEKQQGILPEKISWHSDFNPIFSLLCLMPSHNPLCTECVSSHTCVRKVKSVKSNFQIYFGIFFSFWMNRTSNYTNAYQ